LNSLVGGRSNDLDKKNFKKTLKLTTEFIKLNIHTDIIVTSVPHHHDLHSSTYVNNEIRKYNTNLFKIRQAFDHTKFLQLEFDWIFLYEVQNTLQKLGKAQLAKQALYIQY